MRSLSDIVVAVSQAEAVVQRSCRLPERGVLQVEVSCSVAQNVMIVRTRDIASALYESAFDGRGSVGITHVCFTCGRIAMV